MIIAFEGIDRIGKTTQVEMLHNTLQKLNLNPVIFSFPNYESDTGQLIKKILQDKNHLYHTSDPMNFATLYALNRLEQAEAIREDSSNGYIVLCNRYTMSNHVYQGFRQEGFDHLQICYLEHDLLNIPIPDVYICLYKLADGIDTPEDAREKDVYDRNQTLQERANQIYKNNVDYKNDFVDAKYIEVSVQKHVFSSEKKGNVAIMRTKEEIHETICQMLLQHIIEEAGVKTLEVNA